MLPPVDPMRRYRGIFSRRAFLLMLSGAAAALAGCTAAPLRSADADAAAGYKAVRFETEEAQGTVVVDPPNHVLYLVQGGGQALQYEVGVGKEGYGWSGVAYVHDKQEWPDWYPTKEYLDRRPEIRQAMSELPSGLGMRGGPDNPMGARAMYLWQGKTDTLYRIHGTNEPDTVGHDVSAGCIRLRNADVVDLYNRTPVGTKVVVLPPHSA
jgi:lipoprotein-anchoring transpeptidase ErfK/SrfK